MMDKYDKNNKNATISKEVLLFIEKYYFHI